MPVEYKGDVKVFNGVVYNMYPAVGCGDGCHGCCTNSMYCFLTGGSHLCCGAPVFTMNINEEGTGGVGGSAALCGGVAPMSPIPCFNGCGFGPCAFVSPFEFKDVDGEKRWVGSGQVCSGGLCPCMNNVGDWGTIAAEEDGSTTDRAGKIVPVSMFWPPCLHGKATFALTQKGVGKPTKAPTLVKGGGPSAVEMSR
jgi:hypothetical protein